MEKACVCTALAFSLTYFSQPDVSHGSGCLIANPSLICAHAPSGKRDGGGGEREGSKRLASKRAGDV